MKLNRFAVIVAAGVTLAGCAAGPHQQAAGPAGCKPLGGGGGNSDTTNAVIGGVAGGVLGGVIGSSVSKNSRVGARNGILRCLRNAAPLTAGIGRWRIVANS